MDTATMVAAPTDCVVRVSDICKRYGRTVAIDGISLEVRRGEIFGLIGPDGAGKSSLMKAIAGVLTYDAGTLDVFGTRVDSERSAELIKDRLGLMPQGLGLNLYPDLTVEENVNFFGRLRLVPHRELQERSERLLRMTRLHRFRDRAMRHLSGGMKQKLGLVCSLIHHPQLVILDEPTTGVDPVSRRDFWSILAQLLREEQITAIVSTAYLDEASRFHRAALLMDGRILASGEPDEMSRLAPGQIVELECTSQADALNRLKTSFPQSQAVGPRLRVFVDDATPDDAEERVLELIREYQPTRIHVADPELEDVFIALLRRRESADSTTGPPITFPGMTSARTTDGLAIEAQELIRDFGTFRAVDRVSFQVRPGEIFGLLGANGAGKTTVIKMLTGLLPPTGGTGRVAGADLRRAPQTVKERIGYMSQSFSLYRDLTVRENIRLYAGIYGVGRREMRDRTDWIIGMAELQGREGELAGSLPMGLRQRLALGCALVHQPQILFLDEPTSGVDPIGRRRLWDIIFRLSREQGVAVLVTTHYMSEAEHCDHLALMYAGRIFADASPAELKQELEREAGQMLEVRTDRPLVALGTLQEAGFEGVALFGRSIHVLAPDPDAATQQIRDVLESSGTSVERISVQPLTMEDVFVHRVLALEQAAEDDE